jgi:LAO/AO transport system kinase
MNIDDLVADPSMSDDRTLGRLLSLIEDGADGSHGLVAQLYLQGGTASTLGVTGTPGAGKSTLVSQLVFSALEAHPDHARIAVVAVDPTSPFTGGAILGDRIRMGDHSGNVQVFMRSVANRGHLGGLAASTPAIVAALDGFGFAEIMVETVGVGQAEVDVASACHTTVVVVSAGWGDAVQSAKAGFLEIADVYVVNKADRQTADQTVADLQSMLEIGPERSWTPPVVPTVATDGVGVAAVWDAIKNHRTHLAQSGDINARNGAIARATLKGAIEARVSSVADAVADEDIERLVLRTTDPWTLAAAVVAAR